ncbi:Transcriptional regulator [Yamadazyma tenuis]|uniref:Transcriptional regulator n=1 Tax=Candida tenuis TaxID=2315449 RepID=UPI0027A769E6|nr:Transcriptional regulator [Yamadazyma tenuis]
MTVTGSHSASTTLDDIVNELKLTYDASVGLLEGDAIGEIPSVNILLNLSKLLNNLSKDLNNSESTDNDLIAILQRKVDGEVEEVEEEQEEGSEETGVSEGLKREHPELVDEEEEVAKPSPKRVKVEEPPISVDDDEDDEPLITREKAQPTILVEEEQEVQTAKSTLDQKDEVKKEDDEDAEGEDDEDEEEDEEGEEEEEEEEKEKEKENNEGDEEEGGEEGEEEVDNHKGHPQEVVAEDSLNSADDPLPPVQEGHFTHDNDTRLKNPKSEFVTSQTISAQAIGELGLFSEGQNGLETQGKEYLKRKYGVASYPEHDLQDLLPGQIPNIDFSKSKAPTNQVQFSTFQSYIESFYRPFSNEDLKFLNEKYIIPPGFEKQNYDPDVSPYIIPKLGRFYGDAWSEEDVSLANKLNTTGYSQTSLDSFKPKGSIEGLTDDKLYTEDISCGPLSSRLLSAILSIHEEISNGDEYEDGSAVENLNSLDDENVATQLSKVSTGDDYEVLTESNDFHSIEERLKRELKYIGIFMNLPSEDDENKNKLSINGRSIKTESRRGSIIDNDEWIKNKEDDEVSAEIRMLQKELKEAAARNRQNKKKLIPLVEEQVAYQEFCTILEDLDKQADQAYMKRLKSKSKKKKNTDRTEPNPAQQQAMNTGIRSLLDKRRRWIESIGKLFRPPELMKRVPSESVLEGGPIEEEVDDDANDVAEDVIQEKT